MNLRSMFFLAVIPLVLLFAGCTSIRDLSSQSPYSGLIGKKFILQKDCYICRYYEYDDGEKQLYVANHSICGDLPAEADPKYVGEKFSGMIILGIIPKQSVFTVNRLLQKNTFESSYCEIEASFENSSIQGEIFNVSFLATISGGNGEMPEFYTELVKPLE